MNYKLGVIFLIIPNLWFKNYNQNYCDRGFLFTTKFLDWICLRYNAELSKELLWQKEPVICNGSTIKLVAEVVSTNWQDDYARKVEEYALLNIPEYWIVDYRGLGGWQFIGNPKQPTFTVCHLVNGVYQQQQYRLKDTISSYLFPNLQLKLEDIMPND